MSALVPERPGAFYGRRKGKRLRVTQDELVTSFLPRLRVDPSRPDLGFERPPSPLTLEIGFGGGEHLAARARAHPDTAFIGCEPFVNGVAKLLAVIHREGLKNIRIWDADATGLIPRLPAGAVDRVYLLYPDPWPKRRHRKRRFVSDENLVALARIMRPGAELRFATDIDDYAGWALARILGSPDFRWLAEGGWLHPWPEVDVVETRYEAKAIKAGRKPVYLRFERI
jgi:tRNA (guanine-N7-)-methyltransferase